MSALDILDDVSESFANLLLCRLISELAQHSEVVAITDDGRTVLNIAIASDTWDNLCKI